jgi:hypothetical protein
LLMFVAVLSTAACIRLAFSAFFFPACHCH